MTRIIISAFAVAGLLAASAAHAGDIENRLARLEALEKENAAIRRENEALRQNRALREQNATLKSAAAVAPAVVAPHGQAASVPAATRSDPFAAYAADLPLAYKAPVKASPHQFRIWGEGGAIWSGGDPASYDYSLQAITSSAPFTLGNVGGRFDLLPKVGWQGAGGFDYRFAGSPWHVSGQFRYSEGKASGGASVASSAALPGGIFNFVDSIAVANKESHWLADAAVGRDVAGDGPDSLQLKFGLRIGEWVARNTSNHTSTVGQIFTPPIPFGGILIAQTSQTTTSLDDQRASYIGVGPRLGIEGEIPVAGGWAFNYLADVAVLLGNQKLVDVSSQSVVLTPDIAGVSGNSGPFTTTSKLFSPAFSADLQVGVSYWMQPNLKVTASYRIDALTLFNTQGNVANFLPDRYVHGPHVGVSATF
jgi:hypothetical protein